MFVFVSCVFLAFLMFSNITFSNNTTTLTLNRFFSFFTNCFFVLVVVFITFLRYMFFVFFLSIPFSFADSVLDCLLSIH